ncbi:hypothetical protein FOCC_FOCC008848, partial [Frankliniella occidentalis]
MDLIVRPAGSGALPARLPGRRPGCAGRVRRQHGAVQHGCARVAGADAAGRGLPGRHPVRLPLPDGRPAVPGAAAAAPAVAERLRARGCHGPVADAVRLPAVAHPGLPHVAAVAVRQLAGHGGAAVAPVARPQHARRPCDAVAVRAQRRLWVRDRRRRRLRLDAAGRGVVLLHPAAVASGHAHHHGQRRPHPGHRARPHGRRQ